MKPKKITLLIALIFGCMPVFGQYVQSNLSSPVSMSADSIIISGRIRNIGEGICPTVVINECDISEKSAREFCDIDSNGSFCSKIPLSYPHTFTVNYDKWNFINAFAAPGDSIYIDIDASKSPLSVTFSGDHAEINQQYDTALKYLSFSRHSSVNLPPDTVALEEFMPVFKKYVKEEHDSIAGYARQHNLSEDVVQMLYTNNLYNLANLAMSYRGRNPEEKRAFFLDPIFDIFNEDNTKVMIFPYHISAIMTHFPEVRDKAPKGTVRDIMYACDEDAPIPDRSEFHNQTYYDRLYAQDMSSIKKIAIDAIKSGCSYVYINGEVKEICDDNPLNWLINEYEGHPIYLDVSATWCGPCLAGLKHSESLRKYFKDSDIRFAIIWLRSDKEVWLNIAPTISNAIQIFISDPEMDDMIQRYLNVRGFPTYLMIDRDGNLSKDGVPNYMSPALLMFLNNYR